MGFWCSLFVEVLGGVVTALLLAAFAAYWTVRNRVAGHDREVADIDEDLRRFLRDRDRALQIELETDSADANRRGIFLSGIHLARIAERKRQALHEYRDEATRKRRRYREICEAEQGSLMARMVRRSRPLHDFSLSSESARILDSWRAPATVSGMNDTVAVDDPTSDAHEPELRRLERDGDDCP